MSHKSFLYYLLEEDGRSLYINNGIVSSRGIPTPLPNSPDGWQDILVAWERNITKHGIVRNYTKEMGFVRDGAIILRDSFYNETIDRKMYLLIQKLTLHYSTTYKWVYEYFYKGELDFSTMKDVQDMAKISIMEGGLSKLLKANEATTYDIPFDSDAVNVKMDGMEFTQRVNWLFQEGNTGGGLLVDYREGLLFTTREGQEYGLAAFTVYKGLILGTIDENDTEYFAAVPSDITSVRAIGSVNVKPNLSESNYKLKIKKYNPETDTSTDVTILDVPIVAGFQVIDYDVTFSANTNDRFFLITNSLVEHDANSTFTLEIKYRKATTWVKAYTRKMLWRKLCAKVFGHEEYAVSTLLETDDRLITSGDAIRGLPNAVIKTSINDFFKDVDTDLMAGISIENGPATTNLVAGQRIHMESRTRYYDASNPIALGEPKQRPEVTFATDLAFNKIKVGWQKPDIEDVNGKYDFNGSQQWTTPVQRIAREYDLVSPYKAGPIEIEITRLNLEGKTSTDNNNDNDMFVIVGERSQLDQVIPLEFVGSSNEIQFPPGIEIFPGQRIRLSGIVSNNGIFDVLSVEDLVTYQKVIVSGTISNETGSPLVEWLSGISYKLKRYTWDNAGDPEDFGVASPLTIFNTDLSPKRKLLRHARWLRSFHHNYEGEKIKFQSGDKNTDLKTVLGGVTVQENADITIDDDTLGEAMCLPYYSDFDIKVPTNLVDLLEADANRAFSFSWEGETYVGFLFKAGIAPNTQEQQQYKLLFAPGQDLSPFIYY